MNYIIKPMQTADEIDGKGYVHYKSWHETYAGLIDAEYLNNISQKLVAKVKLKTPVSTGVLRKNWRTKSEGNLAKIVYNNTHYALMWGI